MGREWKKPILLLILEIPITGSNPVRTTKIKYYEKDNN
jgi:hypothetical protein